MTNKKVIIDADPGHDDMMAMLLMLASPSIDVLAVTTVAGNSTIQNVTNNARFILDLAGRSEVPLLSGAGQPLERELARAVVHGESGLDGASVSKQVELDGRAVDEITRLVRENPDEVSLLVLGPQTNIAEAIQRDPGTMKLAREFVIMGGAFNVPGNKNRVAEFNICTDPEAAAIVADFPVRKTYVPLDVCYKVQVPVKEFERIKNDTVRKEVLAALQSYMRNIRQNELDTRGVLMYDALAAYYLLNPSVCETEDVALVIETKGEYTFGMTLVDRRPFSKKGSDNAAIVTGIPEGRFIEGFFTVIDSSSKI